MALFRKSKPSESEDDKGPEVFEPQPEKAQRWFEHAKTAAMSSNYEYALECYANGIKLDPHLMSAHEAMFDAAVRYVKQGGKPASSRDVKRIEEGSAMGKFAAAEFEWMKDLNNYKAAVKALEAAVKAEQLDYGHWIAPRVLALLRAQKKHSKSMLMSAMGLFRDVGSWEASMAVGQMARDLDPSDSELDQQLKNLSAQKAMEAGGYERNVGNEGGFRGSIRDATKQQELIEAESLAVTEDVEERNISRAKAAYEEAPDSPETINKYAQLLRRRGEPADIEEAAAIYERGFERTGEYRFRMNAGDIRIDQLQKEVDALEARNGDPAYEAKKNELLELKAREYAERVERYPTDRNRKYDLGMIHFELGRYDDAMAQFQKAKDEPRLRVRSGHMLGRCFFEEGWFSDAAAEFEEALTAIDATEKDRELTVKYDLMLALLRSADQEGSVEEAKRAKTICSEIARTDITYRDIRARRKEVDDVIKRLSGGGS